MVGYRGSGSIAIGDLAHRLDGERELVELGGRSW
jgi:hypothetical protein